MEKDREKDKIKENNKIEYFPGVGEDDDEVDQMLRASLLKDADEFEQEINENPDLADIEAPEEMFENIVTQLKKKGIWEEGDKEEEVEEKEEKVVALSEEERYALLTEDEKDAMRIGQRMKGTTVWRRITKGIGVVVVALLCVFGVSMASEANRMYLMTILNSLVSENHNITLNTGGDILEQTSDELKTQSDINEQIGSRMPVFFYRPEGMRYESYNIVKEAGTAIVFYKYKEKNVSIRIDKDHKASVQMIGFVGEVFETITVTTLFDQEIEISKMGTYGDLTELIAQFSYDNSSYVIAAHMEKDKFIEMIESLNFL